jgi:hypothetical protein
MKSIFSYGVGAFMLFATFWVTQLQWVPILDDANLIFHEAGHLVLFWAPAVLYFLGGTLMQLAVPLVCMVALWREGKLVSSMLCLWWLGENMLNIGWYMADARTQAIPLLGGDAVHHDWAFLLGEFGLLPYDTLLGGAVEFFGVVLMIAASVLMWFLLQHQTQK